ncbi:Hen1 [Drosophila busckii]|uniref:Small RNA 2'-O-methyltransferase n=1 Tax=Drosophila busckii TaxID=30019 RepID=A0A0M5JAD9_DROBS|nr:Hen1 [Drosophila busckii]
MQTVDIDEALLTTHLSRTDPLVSDYMRQRESPLHVDVFHGSVADSSAELLNTDVVIALELIEHVYDDVLSKIPHNIFGYMHPKIVIISTPNADFNVIFTRFSPLLPNGFRHHDHKFEWTRAEFKAWCLDITEKYPNYMCSIFGVGEAPAGDESVGNVSQIALFVRKDLLDMPLVEPFNAQPEANCETPYRNLHSVDFPFFKDTRTTEEKIWTQVQYELHRATYREDYYDADRYVYKIAIAEILRCVEYLGATAEILQQLLLENKKQMENGYVIIEEDNYSSDHDSHDYSQDAQEQVEDANCTNEVENWDA